MPPSPPEAAAPQVPEPTPQALAPTPVIESKAVEILRKELQKCDDGSERVNHLHIRVRWGQGDLEQLGSFRKFLEKYPESFTVDGQHVQLTSHRVRDTHDESGDAEDPALKLPAKLEGGEEAAAPQVPEPTPHAPAPQVPEPAPASARPGLALDLDETETGQESEQSDESEAGVAEVPSLACSPHKTGSQPTSEDKQVLQDHIFLLERLFTEEKNKAFEKMLSEAKVAYRQSAQLEGPIGRQGAGKHKREFDKHKQNARRDLRRTFVGGFLLSHKRNDEEIASQHYERLVVAADVQVLLSEYQLADFSIKVLQSSQPGSQPTPSSSQPASGPPSYTALLVQAGLLTVPAAHRGRKASTLASEATITRHEMDERDFGRWWLDLGGFSDPSRRRGFRMNGRFHLWARWGWGLASCAAWLGLRLALGPGPGMDGEGGGGAGGGDTAGGDPAGGDALGR